MKIPSGEGKEGFSLQGWVLSFGTTDTPMEGNLIFMLNDAAQAAWGTPVKITEIQAPTVREGRSRQVTKPHIPAKK